MPLPLLLLILNLVELQGAASLFVREASSLSPIYGVEAKFRLNQENSKEAETDTDASAARRRLFISSYFLYSY